MERKTTRRRPPPAPVLPDLTAKETWYLECLRILSKHLGRPPVVHELAAYCGRSKSPVFDAMVSLKHKGRVTQDADKRFVVVP